MRDCKKIPSNRHLTDKRFRQQNRPDVEPDSLAECQAVIFERPPVSPPRETSALLLGSPLDAATIPDARQEEGTMARTVDQRLGLRLREIRERQGLAQAELAALLDVPVAAVQGWEDSRDPLNLFQIIRLAETLDVAPAIMLEMPGKPIRLLRSASPVTSAGPHGRTAPTIARRFRSSSPGP
jgi:transcriptional regulator with XRE-family HTH domain